ncbi:tryptophan halogenase, putative [Novosphingobium nitrogenifigens DSM 19370]|uniref:Tryptophan halogenase, putative n=1 Tax=Novosphingobium nitrogenifigens DSM 19370 TaxID=983920 RepID=F1Z4S1_9SPHN|nr:tryptophan halogenase family protein [Novosphingobium nitrogenifigens]EGD60392.1 tryptophan halogenase, putative [Novosphingobium nitrogenifigens DSM 19370]
MGGGTAGWLAAGLLAARLGLAARDDLQITVVESPRVPILGVGEGTWPTFRQSLKAMGIGEADFLAACDATFKQGSQFVGWNQSPVPGGHSYIHPFTPPHRFGELDLASAWLAEPTTGFDEAVCFQTVLCRAGLAPKLRNSPDYEGIGNYAYHFDAGKVAAFLKDHCIAHLGVKHVADDVLDCVTDRGDDGEGDGAITALRTARHGDLPGDLFIDCSGQHGVLMDRVYKARMVDCRDILLVDTALAIPVPYPQADSPIASVTLATAQSAGWIWDIGLKTRRGTGYVYSSRHVSHDEARHTLDRYVRTISGKPMQDEPRRIAINSGYRERFWIANCVAIGVSAGFIEPLEASSIAMIEISANHLAEHLTFDRKVMAIEAGRFNRKMDQLWHDVIDFLKLHYVLSDRTEPFWLDNRAPCSIPSSLRDNLRIWQNRPPIEGDFVHTCQLFGPASYQYILYGMHRAGAVKGDASCKPRNERANNHIGEVRALTAKLSRVLGPNRDFAVGI